MASHCCVLLTLCVVFLVYGHALQLKGGTVYQYSYSTSTLLSEVNTETTTDGAAPVQKDVGVNLSIDFDLLPVVTSPGSQFIKLMVTSARFTSVSRPAEERDLSFMTKYPAYFQLTGDSIEQVFVVDGDPVFSTNLKKGIMALFQLRQEAGERTEIDVSGECQVSYAVLSPTSVTKTKVNCQNLEIAGQYSTPSKMLGLSVWNKATMHYELKDGMVNMATGTSRLVSYLNIRTSLNGGVTSSQKLSLEYSAKKDIATAASVEDAIAQAEKETGRPVAMSLLPSETEVQQCTEDSCKSPKEVIKEVHDDLLKEKMSSLASAKAFVRVLRALRNSGKVTIAELLTNPDSYYIVPQLIDIVTAAQTRPSQEALMELLSFEEEENVEHPERYLFAAAYSTHPSEDLIRDLMGVLGKKVPSETLQESLLLALSSIVHTFCQVEDQCQQQVVLEVQQLLVSGLEACADAACRGMYLRALGNAGLGATVPIILSHAETPGAGASMTAFTAVHALRRMHKQFITDDVKDAMLRVFHQTRGQFDSSVRAAALDMVLKNQPAPSVLRDILLTTVDQSSVEFSTYVYNSVLDAASFDPILREALKTAMKDPAVNNYNVHSQKGKSSIFTNFLAKTSDLNATYSMYIENSNSGIMKKSGMDVHLLGKVLRQPFMKFGIFAEGLESLVGESEETGGGDSGEEVEATAGMTFTLMDVLLRQIEFFRGSAGLMSAVWNAPSDLTSALQGSLLLQDHAQRVHLSNGLVVSVEVLGVLSMDLSGYVSISLWNRNCEALIKNSGALYIEGTMKLDSSLVESGLVFTGEGQSAIDFTTDADFYEMPLKLCMQMMRPEFTFQQSVMKYEALKSVDRLMRKSTTTHNIPAESYFLNEANSAECRLMKADQ